MIRGVGTHLPGLVGFAVAIFIVAVTPVHAMVPDKPPVASLISVGAPNAAGIAQVSGSAGAVPDSAEVWVNNLQTAHSSHVTAGPDGSFSIPMFAPAGSWLSVHQAVGGVPGQSSLAPGTMIRTAPAGSAGNDFAAISAIQAYEQQDEGPISETGIRDGGQFWIGGSLDSRNWTPGQSIQLQGTFVIYSLNVPLANPAEVSIQSAVSLQRVFDPQGRQELSNGEFVSHILAPTGFAIDRDGITDQVRLADINFSALSQTSNRTFEGTWTASFEVPDVMPDGIYQLVFEFQPFTNRAAWVQGIPDDTLYFEDVFGKEGSTEPLFAPGLAGLIEIGSVTNPRLSWALLVNEFSNGSRSVIAAEDMDRVQVAGHVSYAARHFIVPMNDELGAPRTYRLEPFAPLVSVANRGPMNPPTIPFVYPSGSLHVQIRKPNGQLVDLGTAPFAESFFQEPGGPSGASFSGVSNFPKQYFGLTTLDSRFDYQFDQYGLHEIIATGTIEDVYGNVYSGGGTYEVTVARTLDLETGTFPSTGFEVGDALSPTLIVQPGVPAKIDVRVQHFPESDPMQMTERVFTGVANRFGYFHPTGADAHVFDAPGEYRVDYTARYLDSEGVLWMGSQSWGGVVATPDSALITHGRRGMDNGIITSAWFTVRDSGSFSGHMHFPYFNGDIMWMEDTGFDPTFTADVPTMSLQDTGSDFSDMYLARIQALPAWTLWEPDFVELYIVPGQIPVFSMSASGLSPALQRGAPDNHWGYAYAGSARPGVRVREMVTEANSDNGYWRFDDAYNYQLGVGANGDLTNDFKFQFLGSVYRAPDENFHYYGIHGSMFVLVPPTDPVGVRVFPPFQGNGGGPSGGPIMTLKDEDIDMFFHVGGTRPGSILEVGDFASFAGQVAPTLASHVDITVTAPSGAQQAISGMSNKVGYFYRPDQDFQVSEPGVYTVNVNVWFDGQSSAGPVTAPFPSGNVLGSRSGEYYFYVVEPDSGPLDVDVPELSMVQPGLGPIDFAMLATDELSDVTLHYTTVMPGFVLEEGVSGNTSYRYDAPALHEDFPNLDIADADGRSGVDTVTMSFLVTGVDGGGNTVHRARQVLLQGEELMAPAQEPAFFINAGVNDAWVHAGADKQGMFLTAFPDFSLMFAAWFTFDSVPPPADATAVIGAPDQRWVTALGPYTRTTASLNAELTTGGRFNSSGGDPQQDTAYGTVDIEFDGCASAQVTFDFPTAGESGSFTMNRVLNDNVAICQGIVEGSIDPTTQSAASVLQATSERIKGKTGARSASAAFGINPGMNDAWVNAGAKFQGMFLTIFPELQLIFAAWFTFDTEDNGEAATFGAPDQRWLTALGNYSGTSASLNVENTSGGSFNSTEPAPSQDTNYGTLDIEFIDCNTAEVMFNFPGPAQSGSFTLNRVLDDNVGLCEALTPD